MQRLAFRCYNNVLANKFDYSFINRVKPLNEHSVNNNEFGVVIWRKITFKICVIKFIRIVYLYINQNINFDGNTPVNRNTSG